MRRRLASEGGFGVVELLIAMTVMVVAVMALVAVLNSGMVTLRRAADASTAAAVADKQMEAYRALPNCAIFIEETSIGMAGPTYTADTAYNLDPLSRIKDNNPLLNPTSPCTSSTDTSLKTAHQSLQGPDNRFYPVDTYIVASTTPAGGAAKKVTLVVHNPDSTKKLIRETSTFTPPTGCNNGTHGPVSVGC